MSMAWATPHHGVLLHRPLVSAFEGGTPEYASPRMQSHKAPPLVRLFIFIYIIIASSPPQAATLELLSIAGTGRPVTNQRLRKCGEGAAQP